MTGQRSTDVLIAIKGSGEEGGGGESQGGELGAERGIILPKKWAKMTNVEEEL